MVKPFGASTQELHIYCINVNFIDRNNIASPQILLPHPKPKLKNKSPAIVYYVWANFHNQLAPNVKEYKQLMKSISDLGQFLCKYYVIVSFTFVSKLLYEIFLL